MDIVVEFPYILVVRDVSTHSGVSRLADVTFGIVIFLLGRSAICGLLDNLPPEIMSRHLPFDEGSCG